MRNLKDWPNWVPWQGATSALNITRLVGTRFVFRCIYLESRLIDCTGAVCTSGSSIAKVLL